MSSVATQTPLDRETIIRIKRQEKAFKLAQFLHKHNITAANCLHATADEWAVVAEQCDVSWNRDYWHAETIGFVINRLVELEAGESA